MPANPIRLAVGDDLVTAYIVDPVMPFDQTSAVLAPNPKAAEEVVEVRAFLGNARPEPESSRPGTDHRRP